MGTETMGSFYQRESIRHALARLDAAEARESLAPAGTLARCKARLAAAERAERPAAARAVSSAPAPARAPARADGWLRTRTSTGVVVDERIVGDKVERKYPDGYIASRPLGFSLARRLAETEGVQRR